MGKARDCELPDKRRRCAGLFACVDRRRDRWRAACSRAARPSLDTAKLLNPDPPDKMYAQADALLKKGPYSDAARKFEDLDRDHPYAPEARRAIVMAGYAYYKAGTYQEAIAAAQALYDACIPAPRTRRSLTPSLPRRTSTTSRSRGATSPRRAKRRPS